jgi:hypothetical protein
MILNFPFWGDQVCNFANQYDLDEQNQSYKLGSKVIDSIVIKEFSPSEGKILHRYVLKLKKDNPIDSVFWNESNLYLFKKNKFYDSYRDDVLIENIPYVKNKKYRIKIFDSSLCDIQEDYYGSW